MEKKYYIFHGYGGENSLLPLAEFMEQKGHSTLVIDDQKYPYIRTEMYEKLRNIRSSYQIIFITSAHLWFDEYNFSSFYGPDPNIISAIELLDFLKPAYSVFYPHDLECFMHSSELKWVDLFDLILLPFKDNIYYKLKHYCKHVEIVGWIKKHCDIVPLVNVNDAKYSPAIFPSNIVSFYSTLGPEGYADWFRKYIGPDIPIKMPANDSGVFPILSKEGYQFLDPSKSIYDAMFDHNLIIGSGHSSIIYEAAFSGIPVIALLDGVFPDEVYLKSLSEITGVYPLHPDELHTFLKNINSSNEFLAVGPNILKAFDFERVYKYLTELN